MFLWRWRENILQTTIAASLFVGLVFVGYDRFNALQTKPTLLTEAIIYNSNDLVGANGSLNAEAHASRLPGTIESTWTVSSGFRSPDGVRKRVYLINGILFF